MTVIGPLLAVALLSLTVVIDLRSTDNTRGIRALTARRGRGRSVTLWAVVPDTGPADDVARDAAVIDRIGTAVRNSSELVMPEPDAGQRIAPAELRPDGEPPDRHDRAWHACSMMSRKFSEN